MPAVHCSVKPNFVSTETVYYHTTLAMQLPFVVSNKHVEVCYKVGLRHNCSSQQCVVLIFSLYRHCI